MFYKSPHNYDLKEASDASGIAPGGPSLTIQSMSEDADINVIMKRFGITGKLPDVVRVPTFGDFSEIRDYRSALHSVMLAEDAFMEVPADIRGRFQNDPQVFMDFCAVEGNREELRRMGLMKPLQAEPTPLSVMVVNPVVPSVSAVKP